MKTYKKTHAISRCASDLFLPLACVFGCYVVLHGSTSPGGGFQGGVLVASAILLVYLGYGGWGVTCSTPVRQWRRSCTWLSPWWVCSRA